MKLETAGFNSAYEAVGLDTDFLDLSKIENIGSIKKTDTNNFSPVVYTPEKINLDFGNNNILDFTTPFTTGIVSPPQKSTFTVKGVVRDVNGVPIPGAHITPIGLADKTLGAFTDFNGNYAIEVPKDTLLQVSHQTYNTAKVNANTSFKDITLQEGANNLDEITVKATLKKNKTGLYIGIGLGALLLGTLLVKKRKKTTKKQGLKAVEVTI